MSKAWDIYKTIGQWGPLASDNNPRTLELLKSAAAEWRAAGRYFSAAYVMDQALHVAVVSKDVSIDEYIETCFADCQRCIDANDLDSLEALAVLNLWRGLLRYFRTTATIRSESELLQREMAERLLYIFASHPEGVGYLIRGIELEGHLDGGWRAIVPNGSTVGGTYSVHGNGQVIFSLPSAFRLFRNLGDYDVLRSLIAKFPEEFESVSMQGWKFAVEGYCDRARRAELFAQAADAFAKDVSPIERGVPLSEHPRIWSAENVLVWAKYYRACSALARSPSTRLEAKQLVEEAARALDGTDSGIVMPETYRLGIIVQTLSALVGVEDTGTIEKAIERFQTSQWLFGEYDDDESIARFLADAAKTLEEFSRNPVHAIASGLIASTLEALSRSPLIGSEVVAAVGGAAVEHAVEHALSIRRGIDHSWAFRALEAIQDERALQKVFLLTFQSALPLYAQIRHGPLEYGKDVVILTDEDGRHVLRMFQFKCGDIDVRSWREVKPQLEEIFLHSLETVNITERIDERIGILVCNGHAKPDADARMVAWFERERVSHGYHYEFLSLDKMARWIIEQRLYSALRTVLANVSSVESCNEQTGAHRIERNDRAKAKKKTKNKGIRSC